MENRFFGYTMDGRTATLFTYQTKSFALSVSDYGASLINLIVYDQKGEPIDIVLGYDDVSGYELDKGYYLGCNIGRNANRIANARFTLNHVEYILEQNDGVNNLHSGFSPYAKRKWHLENAGDDSITFSLDSPHMDQGYPGNLKLYITYRILSDASFEISYEAIPDRDTILNVTNHCYFNLNGEGTGNIEKHQLILHADYYTPVNSFLIPNGEILPVEHTPMDFKTGKTIGAEIEENFQQLIYANGYDHNWITDTSGKVHDIATILGDKTGISMTIATDYPGVQIYTGNFLEQVRGKKGHVYAKRDGICFEPQFYPDAVNQPGFVSPVCKGGELFQKKIIYRFENVCER